MKRKVLNFRAGFLRSGNQVYIENIFRRFDLFFQSVLNAFLMLKKEHLKYNKIQYDKDKK